MSIIDQNDYEDSLEVPTLEDSNSLPVVIQNISKISDAIEKCEKILQHVAIGNYSQDCQKYFAMHIRLIAERNKLFKQLKVAQDKQDSKNNN